MTSLIVAGLVVLGAYAALCAFLYVRQADFLFFPVANDTRLAAQWRAQRVAIPGSVTIEGWWAENAHAHSDDKDDITLLYFGGNAEDVLHALNASAQLPVRRMLATNYRGYGGTPGTPSEQALVQDALAIYDYALTYPGVAPARMVVMGRSLGSGVATFLAAHRPVRAAILVTPFDSMVNVARRHYPYFPVAWLLKNRFPSAEYAARIEAPVLILAAEHDTIVPPVHAERLFAAWRGEKKLFVLPNVGHNDIDWSDDYHSHINAFIENLR